MQEIKEWTSNYNPFNSSKLYAHLPRWKEMVACLKDGSPLPSPALITLDPINLCNLDCSWCNADYVLEKSHKKISNGMLDEIVRFLPFWGENPRWKGVDAICIAGGGEPLIHTHTGKVISNLVEEGIGTGIVTNGVYMDKHASDLVNCTWVGVSIDSGTSKTYLELKGKDEYAKVLSNIEKLVRSAEGENLGQAGQGPGVSYKYLLHPKNVHEIYQAAVNAKNTGCKNLHIRPFGVPWDKIGGGNPDEFTYSNIETFREQLSKARELEDGTFKVFGVTHKFDGNFKKLNEFDSCYAIYMTAVIQPPTGKTGFNLGFCCDRRGDPKLTWENLQSPEEINKIWGNMDHRALIEKIDVSKCPRCTYQPHNQIIENGILVDNLTWEYM